MMTQKFKAGDKVRIVKYGAPVWSNQNDDIFKNTKLPIIENHGAMVVYDIMPELVGKTGTVKGSYHDLFGDKNDPEEKDLYTYEIEGILEKCAWYDEQQLELINE